MPISYDQRRQRRQQLAAGLHPELRERIALRHVEIVSKFSNESQGKLAEAIAAGVRIPAAIQFLKENPAATADEILSQCQLNSSRRHQTSQQADREIVAHSDLMRLADLLRTCFPDMPRVTAEAMAGSALLSEVLGLIHAQQTCLQSRHAQSDFVVVVLCGLALKNIEQLNYIIARHTIYQQALQQSGVAWPF